MTEIILDEFDLLHAQLNHEDIILSKDEKDKWVLKNKQGETLIFLVDFLKNVAKKVDSGRIPTEGEFLAYCRTLLKDQYLPYEYSLKAKYEAWVDEGWKDGRGKKIKNWKTKIKNTIPFLRKMYGNFTSPPQTQRM